MKPYQVITDSIDRHHKKMCYYLAEMKGDNGKNKKTMEIMYNYHKGAYNALDSVLKELR